jgi:oligoribonuclease (3'-5' exoribonuclease)
MKYLSFDIEATGLEEDCLLIEYAMVPFDAKHRIIEHDLAYETYIQCPSFEELKPQLNPWVIENNKTLIEKAHSQGIPMEQFKQELINYLESEKIKKYFNNETIILFGKSMSAIDLPFLTRDLGWDFMRKYFSHRQLDFSSVCYHAIDEGVLKPGEESGGALMERFGMGDVKHTALADAENIAQMYFHLLDLEKPVIEAELVD